jgi:hypothetical protein
MKKTILGIALLTAPAFAFAQSSGTATTTQATTTATSTQVICIQNALEKRENALIAGHDAFASAIKTALTNRLTGLKDAWAQTDRSVRQTKRQAAYKAFRTESQSANSTMRSVRVGAWKTFDTEMRACGVRGHGETPQNISYPNSSF